MTSTMPNAETVTLSEVIRSKRAHLSRLANETAGEASALAEMSHWLPRPKGKALHTLLESLRASGVSIKASSFDAIAPAPGVQLDFCNPAEVAAALPMMRFIEIKSANQKRVKPGFSGFFFALTENEISAAEQLGDRHIVALYNKITKEVQLTSVSSILKRARSSNWQVSVQL